MMQIKGWSATMIKVLLVDNAILIIKPLCEILAKVTDMDFLDKEKIGAST